MPKFPGVLPIGLVTIALVACGDSGSSDQAQSTAPTSAVAKPGTASSESPAAIEFKSGKTGIQLEEVLYQPAPGKPPFIELANAGADPVSLQQLTLMVDATPIPLERIAEKLEPGARLLVVFDGPSRVEGSTYHAGDQVKISATEGRASILDQFGDPIDEIAWGRAAGAVNPVAGGFIFGVEPGTSIARVPGATRLRSSHGWVGYPPDEATPGSANPLPPVRSLHPMSGARTSREGASLSWFPVPAATGYRLQVAAEKSFAKTILDQTTATPMVSVSSLPAGRLLWQVQAQFAGNQAAAWSATSVVTLIDEPAPGSAGLLRGLMEFIGPTSAHAQAGQAGAGTLCPQSSTPLAQEACWILPVPLIKQHKDTQMLLLEHDKPSGLPHPWDADHDDLDEDDRSDNMNCALASLAMMNRRAGGNLSQDRIGYEAFKNRATGPERDLMYGGGLDGDTDLPGVYQFVLGVPSVLERDREVETLWTNVKSQVEAGKPVLAAKPGHAFVIIGYRIRNGNRILVVNDPWHDTRQEFDIDDFEIESERGWLAVSIWRHWTAVGRFVPGQQEDSVTRDSDGDGVVDFDETERFHTKPNDNDSDSDGVGDKQDIYASVFDAQYGYARFGTGRDEDRDRKPMELDSDSDSGGCRDGMEDENGNGIYEAAVIRRPETWNFDFLDDACQELAGHLVSRTNSYATIVPDMQWGGQSTQTSISVRLKPEPGQPGFYIDDGSTFHYRGSHNSLTVAPQCTMIGQSWAGSSGDFTGYGAAPATASITDDGKLAVHFVAGIRPEHTGGWADICGQINSGQAGDSHSAEFRDECLGDPLQPGQQGYVPGRKIFRFNCHDPEWSASGTVSVP